MPFSICPRCRVPVCCPVTYQTSLFEGYSPLWNFSLAGWRFSGDLQLGVGNAHDPPYQWCCSLCCGRYLCWGVLAVPCVAGLLVLGHASRIRSGKYVRLFGHS